MKHAYRSSLDALPGSDIPLARWVHACRGLGTSSVGQDGDGLGWSESSSAAALAVATIVIPGIDAFFASKKVEQWYDKVSVPQQQQLRRTRIHS